ncbi:uncharacterized protein LOC123524766 [Mercenaria mercenaria]|uniref:uncharacterized protein LOC123524766 n=1 Tax=Mercenaria mercenaria TaxID=6596 RepID=UPI00234E9A4D|nr:uncharacterized protein LOC123524766 [Mercenaria mercenaria]XP_053394469.1 uncharacterized protein LOC123524766 [Mercenaria mercenaria]
MMNGMDMCIKTVKTLCIVLFALCLLGIEVSAGKCFAMSPNYDVWLLAGSDLQLNCSLRVQSNGTDCVQDYSVNKTRINKGNQDLPADIFDYHVEEKTLAMTIRHVTVNDSGTYICRYGDTDLVQAFRPVHIGEAPGEPNLTCVSKNLNNLRCSFSLSRQPVNILIDWTMEYRMGWGTSEVNCFSNSDSVIICEPCPEDIWASYHTYTIFVEGVNETYGVQVNKTFTVKTNESIVKPNPVAKLGFYNESSNVQLYWDGPRGLTYKSEVNFAMDYKVTVTSKWDNRTEMIRNALESHKVFNLTDFIPFANYSVMVQAKPTAARRDIYWSSGSTVNFETPNTVSEHSVSMATGSYLMLDCGQHVMCPIIYWKNPARKFWNGPITGYKVIVEEFELSETVVLGHINKRHIGNEPAYRLKRVIKPSSENITGMSVSGALTTTMMRNEDYRVEIMLINSEGVSASSSELLIPNWTKGQMLKPVWISVEMDDSSVYISWYIDPKYCAGITTVSYYWCLLDADKPFNSTFVSCKENFDWLTFNITNGCGNETAHKIGKSHDYSDVKYAVSVETDGVSGGLMWEKFRFNKQDVPEKPLYSVNSEGTSLIIEILYAVYYNSEGGRPEQYSVVYSECLQGMGCYSGGGVKKKFMANFTKPVYTINDLKPGSQYSVYVTSENRFGKSVDGELIIRNISKVTGLPNAGDSSNLAVVLGSVFGSLFLIVIVGVLIILCRKKHNQWTAGAKIEIPDMDEAAMLNGSYTRTDSEKDIKKLSDDHDSGKGSDSPASSLGQIDPLHQQNEVIESVDDQPHETSSTNTDGGSDKQHPALDQQEMSPTLFGYRNNVFGGSSNGQCTVEISDDESDEESEISEENKVNKLNSINEKNSNDLSADCDKLSKDYSKAAIPENQNGEDVTSTNSANERHESDESSRDKLIVLSVFELTEQEEDKNTELIHFDQALINDKDSFGNENVMSDKSENSANPEDIEKEHLVIDENLEGLDSDGHELKAFSDLDENVEDSWDSPYKNPDQISLGDGSTVSDVSDSESTNSDDLSDKIEDKESEMCETNDIGEDKGKVDSEVEGDDRMMTCEVKQDNAGVGEKLHDVVLNNLVKDTAKEDDLKYSGNTGHNEIMSEEIKSTSGPASLESYIRYESNGFVKSPKYNNEGLKKVETLKLSQKPKTSDIASGMNKEDTQMSKF